MEPHEPRRIWERAARRRRLFIFALILLTTAVACSSMADLLPHRGASLLEKGIVAVFGILFAWISIGFWEAVGGLFTLAIGRDRYAITATDRTDAADVAADVRTAILIPISNEDTERVFAGLRATYQSLERTGQLDRFDFFVLSDSSNPDTWVAEEVAWAGICHTLKAFNRIYYRHRRYNARRKSGNIADFCRRWGRNYRYMVVFDADSVMAGATLVKMVKLMEQNPRVGIVQTCPQAANRESLLARVEQFSNHVYGPMFTAGLHFMQLGDSHFWGHNAIIRIEPFMRFCALPQLPGKPPLGGEILSHDFVEAALMRKAGWEVWLAYDLDGSYEEMPPTLLNELKRDRRWCQGNLQHMRLLFAEGLFPAHRALFLHGIMAYGSALLWFLFLSLSTAAAIAEAFVKPDYFPAGRTLFPAWPVWQPLWAQTLLATTAIILFLPKFLSLLVIICKGQARRFGGIAKLTLSVLAEVVIATFLAPTRMLSHSKFVLMTLLGWQVGWGPQQRGDQGTSWAEAVRFHWTGTACALAWALVLFVYNRSFLWWNLPIIVPLVLAIPMSAWTSRMSLGRALRTLGLFLIPEEKDPPEELRQLARGPAETGDYQTMLPGAWDDGFVRAVADPQVNHLHIFMLRQPRTLAAGIVRRRQELVEKALSAGPQSLSAREKKELLCDPRCLAQLHQRVWSIADKRVAYQWGLP